MNSMYNGLKKLVAGILCFVFVVHCLPENRVDALTLEDTVDMEVVFGEYDSVDMKYEEATVLKIDMKTKGSFALDFNPKKLIQDKWQLYNENNQLLDEDYDINTKKLEFSVDKAGTYYLKLWTVYPDYVGTYTYFATVTPSEEATMEICLSVKKGKTLQLGTIITNCKDKEVKWSSSKKSVATVSSTGKVKGVKKGTATIKAWNKAGLVAKIKVKVE